MKLFLATEVCIIVKLLARFNQFIGLQRTFYHSRKKASTKYKCTLQKKKKKIKLNKLG